MIADAVYHAAFWRPSGLVRCVARRLPIMRVGSMIEPLDESRGHRSAAVDVVCGNSQHVPIEGNQCSTDLVENLITVPVKLLIGEPAKTMLKRVADVYEAHERQPVSICL